MNYLTDYLLYCKHTESPQRYHLWSGISSISHIIGRRVWLDMGAFTIYPNMYIALVGDPGLTKSTAMRLAEKVVKESSRIVTAPASITKEAIVKLMGEDGSQCHRTFKYLDKPVKYSQLSFFPNEMVTLINSGGNAFGMIEFFTDVWDRAVYDDVTKNKGSFTVEGPYISILGCITTDTVKQLMGNKVITAGMSRRMIFVIGTKNEPPKPWPQPNAEELAARNRAVAHAKRLADVAGHFAIHPDTSTLYEKFYHNNALRIESEAKQTLQHFLRSKAEIVFKVAMCLSLCHYDLDPSRLVVRPEDYQLALDYVTAEEAGAAELFEGTGRNELAMVMKDILTYIRRHATGVSESKLLYENAHHGTNPELMQVLTTLIQGGQIERTQVEINGTKRTVLIARQNKDPLP